MGAEQQAAAQRKQIDTVNQELLKGQQFLAQFGRAADLHECTMKSFQTRKDRLTGFAETSVSTLLLLGWSSGTAGHAGQELSNTRRRFQMRCSFFFVSSRANNITRKTG